MNHRATTPGQARHRSAGAVRSTLGLLAMLLASAGAATLLALRVRAIVPTRETATTLGVDTWVELAVLVAGLGAAAWTLLGAVAALVGVVAVRRGRPGRTADAVVGRWAPAVVRRLARGAVGAGVGAGLALTPAAALADDRPGTDTDPAVVLELGWESTAQDPAPEHPPAADADLPDEPAPSSEDGDGSPGEEPAEPSAEPPADPTGEGPDDRAEGQHVDPVLGEVQRTSNQVDAADETVVVRGDTLWDIAARDLPPGATDADILRAVTAWHDANRDVIGGDPDTILPGQVLHAP